MEKGRRVISMMQNVVIGVLISMVILVERGEATTFVVGGTKGWTVPSDTSNSVFNQWAEKMRFQTGDSLLFVYHPNDSVLRVNKEDYNNCNTNSPVEKHTDGHTEIKLDQSGPHYFISGNKDNCLKNEKLVVVVLAERTKKTASSPPPSAASPPAPATSDGGSAAAPSSEFNPPKSGAVSMIAVGFVGSLGAFLGSSLLMAF